MDAGPAALVLVPLIGLVAVAAYALGGRFASGVGEGFVTVVRCREGHIYRTIWAPMISIKAIRLGPVRYQYCPVGRHWTLVTPVDPADLNPAERREARRNADSGVP